MSDQFQYNSINKKRVAVITGSGRGIGKAIAIDFSKLGYHIIINDLEREEELRITAKEISKIGDDNNNKVAYIVGDVSEEKIAIALMEEAMNKFGRIDTLVNTAAISEKVYKKNTDKIPTNTSYFTLEEYEIADASLKGAYYCIREAAKQMVITAYEDREKLGKNKEIITGGADYSIINISSPYESIPRMEADVYTSSMSGVEPSISSRVGIKSLTKTVALQLAGSGIRVNAIAPGIIATDIVKEQMLENEQKKMEKEKNIPFHRVGTPEEIAKIAVFLASDAASYITGSLIYADGGLSLYHSNYFLEKDIEQD